MRATGLRRFLLVAWELAGQFAAHLPLVAGPGLIYATWLMGMRTGICAGEKALGLRKMMLAFGLPGTCCAPGG